MVYIPLAVARDYMENKWKVIGGRPETKRERAQEILLQWYIWLGIYPTDSALWQINNQLHEYYDGGFKAG